MTTNDWQTDVPDMSDDNGWDTNITIDFGNIDSSFLLKEGKYRAEIVQATGGKSKNEQPKIDLRWRIIGGTYNNRQVRDVLSFHENALPTTKRTLVALGVINQNSQLNMRLSEIAENLLGLTGVITIAVKPAKDGYEAQNVVKYVAEDKGDTDKIIADSEDIPF